MKNRNGVIFAVASTGLLSLLSFPAIADVSTPYALKNVIKINAEKKLAAEGKKFTHIASLAGSKQDELMARKDEAANSYKKWNDAKSAALTHYPNSRDYRVVDMAAKEYSHANKAFIDLQKSIIAQNGFQLDTVSIKRVKAAEQTIAESN